MWNGIGENENKGFFIRRINWKFGVRLFVGF